MAAPMIVCSFVRNLALFPRKQLCLSCSALLQVPRIHHRTVPTPSASHSLHQYSMMSQPSIEETSEFSIRGALILVRRPVITAELNDIQKRYQHLLAQLEFEQSSLSDHEMRHKADLELAANRLREDFDESTVDVNLLTAVDMEDLWTEERKNFTLASRETKADVDGNKKTSKRVMDQSLYLLVEQVFGEKTCWVFPQTDIVNGESLRETVQRVADTIQDELTPVFFGNAPSAYEKHKFPNAYRSQSGTKEGAKIFYYKSIMKPGEDIEKLKDTDLYKDHIWATCEEAKKLLKQSSWRSVNMLLHKD